MKNYSLILIVLLCSCTYNFSLHAPSSSRRGSISLTTGRPDGDIENGYYDSVYYQGYTDGRVIKYRLKKSSIKLQSPSIIPLYNIYVHRKTLAPGAVWVSNTILMDESEISNISWKEFLCSVKADSAEAFLKSMLPDPNALPVKDYFSNNFYLFYPVVGISYEQAKAYCQWRTQVVNKQNQDLLDTESKKPIQRITLTYRLPTEREWETYAGGKVDLSRYPYGSEFTTAIFRVNPDAAAYLKSKNNLTQSIKEIKADIGRFNKREEELPVFSIKRTGAPYFLQPLTPFYVYDTHLSISNYAGICNMIGNVAELVEEKGIVKGGSYLDKLEDCEIKDKGIYTGPAPYIGFRPICEVKPAN